MTWVSTSSGARPGASVRTVTVGFVMSGRTSTGSSVAVRAPSRMRRRAAAMTSARFFREKRMRWLSMEKEVDE